MYRKSRLLVSRMSCNLAIFNQQDPYKNFFKKRTVTDVKKKNILITTISILSSRYQFLFLNMVQLFFFHWATTEDASYWNLSHYCRMMVVIKMLSKEIYFYKLSPSTGTTYTDKVKTWLKDIMDVKKREVLDMIKIG